MVNLFFLGFMDNRQSLIAWQTHNNLHHWTKSRHLGLSPLHDHIFSTNLGHLKLFEILDAFLSAEYFFLIFKDINYYLDAGG